MEFLISTYLDLASQLVWCNDYVSDYVSNADAVDVEAAPVKTGNASLEYESRQDSVKLIAYLFEKSIDSSAPAEIDFALKLNLLKMWAHKNPI